MLNPKPFTKADWEAYSGCENNVPYIATLKICDLQIDFIFDEVVSLFFYDIEDNNFELLECITLEDNALYVADVFKEKTLWTDFVGTLLTTVTVISTMNGTKVNLESLDQMFRRLANWGIK